MNKRAFQEFCSLKSNENKTMQILLLFLIWLIEYFLGVCCCCFFFLFFKCRNYRILEMLASDSKQPIQHWYAVFYIQKKIPKFHDTSHMNVVVFFLKCVDLFLQMEFPSVIQSHFHHQMEIYWFLRGIHLICSAFKWLFN